MMTREEINARRNTWLKRRRAAGICTQCGKHSGGGLCDGCKEKAKPYLVAYSRKPKTRAYRRKWTRNKAERDKATVFAHYGNQCACCGEAIKQFLTIDHSERNGSSDPRCHYPGKPKHYRVTGGRWYHVIIKLGFPKDLRLLCWNCNHAEHIYGSCPHKVMPIKSQSLTA